MPNNWSSGYTFPILNSNGTASSTIVDLSDMFVRKELFIDAGLWAWGWNDGGQLGNGNTTTYSSPIQVGTSYNWKQVAIATYASCGIQINGTLWAWGHNDVGQLGNGNTSYASSPIQIGNFTNWDFIAVSQSNMLAIKTDGTLWGWGNNQYGQIGNGTTTSYSSPIQIGSLTNWKQVSLNGEYISNNYFFSSGIQTNNTLWTWGNNQYGQLGNGTTINYSSPIQVGSLTNWQYVSSGVNVIYAIKNDGTLWAWGMNTVGQLGNGTTVNYSSPIQIGALTNWKYITATCAINNLSDSIGSQTMAIKTDGTLWGWGNNQYGQLGIGAATAYYSSPIQIGSLTSWKQVSAGWNNTLAISSPDLPD